MKYYNIHSRLGKTSSGDENTPSELVTDLKGYGIEKVGISCLSGISTRERNNLIYRAMQEYPEVIEGYAFINPKDAAAENEIDLCLGTYGIGAVKLHSWKHGYYPDNSGSLDHLLDKIDSYGVHVQTHVGTAPISSPYAWAEYAKKHPHVRFISIHTEYYEFGIFTIEVVKDLPNVWMETSGQMNVKVSKKTIAVLELKHACFGTDWPYKPVNIEISEFYELELTEEQRIDIFYQNAEKLWKRVRGEQI